MGGAEGPAQGFAVESPLLFVTELRTQQNDIGFVAFAVAEGWLCRPEVLVSRRNKGKPPALSAKKYRGYAAWSELRSGQQPLPPRQTFRKRKSTC